jgi:hypothetical protein
LGSLVCNIGLFLSDVCSRTLKLLNFGEFNGLLTLFPRCVGRFWLFLCVVFFNFIGFFFMIVLIFLVFNVVNVFNAVGILVVRVHSLFISG